MNNTVGRPDFVRAAFDKMRAGWVHVVVFSAISNILMLTGSLYMMQVYDRVLASRSVSTLLVVSLLAILAYALQGILDHFRLRILGRIGAALDEELSPLTVRSALSVKQPKSGDSAQEALRPFRDLDAVRAFLTSMGPTALIDLPFTPLFIIVCFILHPALGWLALMAVVFIVSLTIIIDRRTMQASIAAAQSGADQFSLIDTGRRNAELMTAMGMKGSFASHFEAVHRKHVADALNMAEAAGGIGSFAKVFRHVLQSAVIGIGALLVIRGEMSGGSMLAASILTSRALAPVELAMAHWKGFLAARQGFSRLKQRLPHFATEPPALQLQAPSRSLTVEDVAVVAPASGKLILSGVSITLQAGQALGLVGPSGSGKSTLARALVGAWPLHRGSIRLDGAHMHQWDSEALGSAIGLLAQDVELFPGTIAFNIARMTSTATSQDVLAASKAAGAHDMIVALPNGYDTIVGEGGATLSGGQRQRIALARALFGDPFLVVLDEPNSSLDAEGDAALSAAIEGVKARGGIVIVITHRPSGLAAVDLVSVLKDGRLRRLGPRDEVLGGGPRPQTDIQQPAASGEALKDPAAMLKEQAAAMRARDEAGPHETKRFAP